MSASRWSLGICECGHFKSKHDGWGCGVCECPNEFWQANP